MDNIEKQVKDVLGNSDLVSDEGYELICKMINWLMNLIKDYGNKDDLYSEDGQGFSFNFDNVRLRLEIKHNSEFYTYKKFKDYILILLTQVLQKSGYIIKIREEGRPVSRFTLMVHKKTKYERASVLELIQNKNREEVNKKLNTEVEKDTTKHWSEGFKNRMIELWQLEYANKLGDIPEKGSVLKLFAPAMYKVGLEEFPEDIKEHSKRKDGSKRTKKEMINLIYFRYKRWIEIPNVRAKELGQVLPYGNKLIKTEIPTVNIPFTQILDNNSNNDLEQFSTVTTSDLLVEYTVMFKYKLSNKLFSKWFSFSAKYKEFNEVQAYLNALKDLICTVGNINNIKVDNKSITIIAN